MKDGETRVARVDFTEHHPGEEDKAKRFVRIEGQAVG